MLALLGLAVAPPEARAAGGAGITGPSLLAPRERAVYRIELSGDTASDACDVALEVTLPAGFRFIRATEPSAAMDAVRGAVSFVPLPKLAAGTSEVIELELEAPSRAASGSLCASLSFGACPDPRTRDLRAGPACIALAVPAPAGTLPAPSAPPPSPKPTPRPSNALGGAIVPCGTRPVVFPGGGTFNPAEWADALVVPLGTTPAATLYMKTNADDLFAAIEVLDASRNANNDVVKLYINQNADNGNPEAVDRAFQLTRGAAATQYLGSGAGYTTLMSPRTFSFELQERTTSWVVEMRIPLSELAGPVDPFQTVGLGVEVRNGAASFWPVTFDGQVETTMPLHDLDHCAVATCTLTTWSQAPDLLDGARMTPIENIFDSITGPSLAYASARFGTSADVRATRFDAAGSTGTVLKVEALLPLYTDNALTDDQLQVELLVGGVSYGRISTVAADLSPHVGAANAGIVALDLTTLYGWQMADLDPGADLDLRVTAVRNGAGWDNASLFLDAVGLRVTGDGTCGTFAGSEPDIFVSKDDGYAQVVANGILTYQISYGNRGTATATAVTILDAIPVNTSYHRGQTGIASPPGTTGVVDYSVGGGPWLRTEPAEGARDVRLRFTVAILAPTEPNTYFAAFQVRVDPAAQIGDRIRNQVTIAATQADANPSDNSDWDDGPAFGDDEGDLVGAVAIPSLTIPCIQRPATHDGVVDALEYQGAGRRNIQRVGGALVETVLYHDLNYLYVGFIVHQASTGVDFVGIAIDSFNNKLYPDSTDHYYEVRGNRRATVLKGVGSNTDANHWTNDNQSGALIRMVDLPGGGAWSAELFIPLADIGISGQGDVIGLGLFTYASGTFPAGADTNSASTWANTLLNECAPTALFTAVPACAGLPVVFTDRSVNGPTSWSWDFGDGSPVSTLQSPTHVYAAPGTYSVTLTVCDGTNCGTPRTSPVIVYPLPQPFIQASVTSACISTTTDTLVTLDGSASLPGQGTIPDPAGYFWTTNLGQLSSPNGSVVTLRMAAGLSGTATIVLQTTDAPNGCVASTSIAIPFHVPPVAALVALPARLCSDPVDDMTVRLDASATTIAAGASAQSFTWGVPAGHSIVGSGSAVDWILPAGTTGAQTATVTITDSNTCVSQTQVTVDVDALGQAGFTMTPPSPLCTDPAQPMLVQLDGGASLPGTGVIPAAGYAWTSDVGSIGTSGGVTETLTLLPGTTGPVNVCLSVTNSAGCLSPPSCQVYQVLPQPVPSFTTSVPPVSCTGGQVIDIDLDASATVGTVPDPAGYRWTAVPAGLLPIPDGRLSRVSYPAGFTGIIRIDLVVVDANGCTQTAAQTIELKLGPTVSLLPAASTRCADPGQPAVLALDGSGSSSGAGIPDPTGYAWTATAPATLSASDGSRPTLTVPAGFSGVVTVGLTVTDGDGCRRSTSVDHTFLPVPVPSFTTSRPPVSCTDDQRIIDIDLDASATLGTVPDPAGYRWTAVPAGLLPIPDGRLTRVSYPAGFSGIIRIDLAVNDANGCPGIASRTIEIKAGPAVALLPAASTRCADASQPTLLALDGSGSSSGAGIPDPTGYAWTATAPATLSAPDGSRPTLTLPPGYAGVVTVGLTVTDADGCSRSTAVDHTFLPAPVACIAPGPTDACASATLATTFALDAGCSTGSAGLALAWSVSAPATRAPATGPQTTVTVPAGYVGPVTVTLDVTDDTGCVASVTRTLVLHGGPTVIATASPSRSCADPVTSTTFVLDSRGTVSADGITGITWLATPPATVVAATGGLATLTVPPGFTGNATARLTATDGAGCTASLDVVVPVHALPVPDLVATPVSACDAGGAGAVFDLDASGSTSPGGIPPAGAYAWTATAGSVVPTSAAGDQARLTAPIGYAGVITVTVTISDQNGCLASLSRDVTVVAGPSAVIVLPATGLCSPTADVTLPLDGSTSSGPGGIPDPAGYAWTTTAGVLSASSGARPGLTVPAGFVGTIGVRLVVTDANGCSSTTTSDLTVTPRPVAAGLVVAPVGCPPQGGALVFTLDGRGSAASSPATLVTYAWTVTGGGLVADPAAALTTATYPPGTTGTFDATLAVSDSLGCTSTDTRSFTARATGAPVADLQVTSAGVCAAPGSPTVIALDASGSTATPPESIASFVWWASGGTLGGSSGMTETVTVPAGVFGRFTARVTVTDTAGCAVSADVVVDVIEPPAVSIGASPARSCEGASGTSFALSSNGVSHHPSDPALTYAWSASEGGPVAAVPATALLVPRTDLARDVTLTLVVSDAAGCVSAPATAIVHLDPSPAADFTVGAPLLALPIAFDAAPTRGGTPPYTYAWAFGDGGTSALPRPAHTYAASGAHTVTLDVTDALGCTSSAAKVVDVPLAGAPTGTLAAAFTCARVPVALDATVTGGRPPYATSWTFGDGGQTSTPGTSTTHVYAQGGTYAARAVVTDALGAAVTLGATVTVGALPTLVATTTGPGLAGAEQRFDVTVADAPGATVSWAFSDGGSATGASCGHVFAAPGPAAAVVTVTSAAGCAAVATVPVSIEAGTTVVTFAKTVSVPQTTAGAEIEYLLSIRNGQGVLRAVELDDTLPAGFAYVAGSLLRDGASHPASGIGAQLRIGGFDLAPGAATTFRYRVLVGESVATGSYDNSATLAAKDAAGGRVFLGPRVATVRVVGRETLPEGVADLRVRKTADPDPEPPASGGLVRYRIEYENRGSAPAEDVVLHDDWPSSVAFLEENGDYGDVVGARLEWRLGTVQPGSAGSVQYALRLRPNLPDGTPIRNAVLVSSSTPDANPSDNRALSELAIGGQPDLVLTKTVATSPDPAVAGAIATYTLSYTNRGLATATQATITDDYDESKLELESLPPGGVDESGVLRIALGDVAPGASGTVTYTAKLREGASGGVENTARAESRLADAAPSDNTAAARFDVVVNEATLALTGEALPTRRCHQPQVEVALRGQLFDTAGAMLAAAEFLRAALALERSPAAEEPLLGASAIPKLKSQLRTFARLNVESLYLDSGMGLRSTADTAAIARGAGLEAPGTLGSPVYVPFFSMHPVFAVNRDLAEPWCLHDTHRATSGAAIGQGLAAIAAYSELAATSGDAAFAFRSRLLLDGADRAVTLLLAWREGSLGTDPGHLPSRVLLPLAPDGTVKASVEDGKARITHEGAVARGLARLVATIEAHPEAAPAGAASRARTLLVSLLGDLARHVDGEGRLAASAEGESPRLEAAPLADVAEALEAGQSLGLEVPPGLPAAVLLALDALGMPDGDVAESLEAGPAGRGPATLEAASAAIRARAALGDLPRALAGFRRLEAAFVEPRLRIYRSDPGAYALSYTPATLGSLLGALSRLLEVAAPADRGGLVDRMALSIEKIAVEAGLQTGLVGRDIDGGGLRLMLGSSGEVKVAPAAADAAHALAPVLLDRVSFMPQGVHHRDLSLVDAARSLREEGSAVAYLSGTGSDCRTAQVRLVDRRFETASGLFAIRAMEDAGRALRAFGAARSDLLLRQFGEELLTTVTADRTTLGALSGMGLRFRFATGIDGRDAETARLDSYARAAGLAQVPATVLPVWLAFDRGDPVFGSTLDPHEPYAVGWDPSRFAPGLSAAALGETLLSDVRGAVLALERGTPLDRFTALVRLHAATLEVELIDRSLRDGAFGSLEMTIDSEGRPVQLAARREGASLLGDAALLRGVVAYTALLGKAPLAQMEAHGRPPLAAEAAARAGERLLELVLRARSGGGGDPLALAQATGALVAAASLDPARAEALLEAARGTAAALAGAGPTQEVSPLAVRALALEALAKAGASEEAVRAAFRALLDGHLDRVWRIFQSGVEAKPDREGVAGAAFLLTDLDVGAVLGGLSAAMERLNQSEREEAADLVYAAGGRMLYETGLQRPHRIEARTAEGTLVATAAALSRSVRVTISDSPVQTGSVYPGDLLRTTFVAHNATDSSVAAESAIVATVPAALAYVPGSARVNGQVAADPAAGDSLVFSLGRVGGGESREVTWLLRVKPDAAPGSYRVNARATGKSMPGPAGKPLETPPVTHAVPVAAFGEVTGRVFLDRDRDGKDSGGEPGVPDVTVALDDGTATVTDAEGRYSLKNLIPAGYVVKLLEGSLPAPMSSLGAEELRLRVAAGESAHASFTVRSADVITGIVFRDANADRRRNAGEDTVAGVVVETGGGERAITDRSGRYVLRGASTGQQALRISRSQPYTRDLDDLRLEPSPLPRTFAGAGSGSTAKE